MAKAVLSARDGIEILDRALVLSLRQFWPLLRLGLIPFMLYAAFIRIYARAVFPIPVRIGAFLIASGFLGLVYAAGLLGAWESVHGRPIDAPEVWRRMARRGLGVFVASVAKLVGVFFGTLVFIIPGLYLLLSWFAVPAVNIIEELGVSDSFTRSTRLSGGASDGIIASLGVVYVITTAASFGLTRGGHYLGLRPGTLVAVAAAFALHFVLTPMHAATGALLYLELRIKKEGYDLEGMLAALPDSGRQRSSDD